MKGIIFSAPMVQVILSGRKDVTRRPMNPQPVMENGIWRWRPKKGVDINMGDNADLATQFASYKVGEMVYCKETWRTRGIFDNAPPRMIPTGAQIWYEADWDQPKVDYIDQAAFNDCGKLRSSMFMPEWASRIHLKVLSVRAERLQEITEKEAIREGMTFAFLQWKDKSAKEIYSLYWDVLYGAGSWARNDWVFCYEMQRVESRQ